MEVTIDEILVGDPPEAWEAAGFTVDDDGSCRIGQVRVRLVGRDGGKRILGWSLRGAPAARLADGTFDGIPTTASDAAPVEPASHPNGSLYIDHVVLLTPDLARTTEALATIGVTPRGERDSDTYGAPMRQVFFRLGEVILELIGQIDAAGEGAPGFFGLAVTVDDLDAARSAPRRPPRERQGRRAGGPAHRHPPPPRGGHERRHRLHVTRSRP